MLKKRFGSGLVFAACLCAAPGSPAVERINFEIRDARDLATVCRTPASDPHYTAAIHFCEGFMVGAYRYYLATMKGPDAKPFVCLPEPTPSRDGIVADFSEWMTSHTQYNGDPAVDVLFRFAEEKFPCKG